MQKERSKDNTSSYNYNFKPLAFFCECKGHFVPDLVVTPEDQFYCGVAHLIKNKTEM